MRGEAGTAGVTAARVSVTTTGEGSDAPVRGGVSRRLTSRGNCSATALATSRARSGEVSRTVMSSSTVSSGLLALTASASASGVVARPSCRITGWSTAGLSTRSV